MKNVKLVFVAFLLTMNLSEGAFGVPLVDAAVRSDPGYSAPGGSSSATAFSTPSEGPGATCTGGLLMTTTPPSPSKTPSGYTKVNGLSVPYYCILEVSPIAAAMSASVISGAASSRATPPTGTTTRRR